MHFGTEVDVEMPTLAAFVKRLRLRRAWTQREFAQHAHLGIGTVQKLEQGDKVSVGDRALSALADAVCDNEHEREHLRALGGRPGFALGGAASAADMSALLDQLTSIPAAWVVDWGVVAANDRYRRLMPGIAEAPSIAHWLFGDPRSRMTLPDWQTEAAYMVGILRHYYVAAPSVGATDDTAVTARIVRELAARHPDFRRFWATGDVYVRRPESDRRVWTPADATMTVWRESLIPAASGWLAMCFPSGEES
ncbi:helix-turn-helix transcriptional regulator [Nocardia tengchongensis]|uniref:helix-turn-helix transcriptional regulator n=1 Tax=Nocardia tengchongensis TaxID=2055889 RepID=UPI0033FAD7E8